MALTSPGVEVSVVDESFYTPAEPGTVPMIFVATQENKTNGAGTGTAVGTLKSNAGKPYLLTSQRELAEVFGDPKFQIDANLNPVHGSELNEYGLQAAYSFLGVSNRAYIVRADVDLGALTPRTNVPSANPDAGTYWLDTASSVYGLQVWNNAPETEIDGQTFTNVVPTVITDTTQVVDFENEDYTPKASVGAIGDYAIVSVSDLHKLWYRNRDGAWVVVGSPEWQQSHPTVLSSKITSVLTGGTFKINNTTITVNPNDEMQDVADTITQQLSLQGITGGVVNNELAIFVDQNGGQGDGATAGEIEIETGNGGDTVALTELGIETGFYYPPALQISKHTSIPTTFKRVGTGTGRPTGSIWLKTTTPNAGSRWRVKLWNDETKVWDSLESPLFPSAENAILELDRTGGGANLELGELFIQTNVAGDSFPLATWRIYRRAAIGSTVVTTGIVTNQFTDQNTYSFTLQSTSTGTATLTGEIITFTGSGTANDAATIASAISNAGIPNVSAEIDGQNRVVIKHSTGGDMRIIDTVGATATTSLLGISADTENVFNEPGIANDPLGGQPFQWRLSNWNLLTYRASDSAITKTAEAGTLWYNSIVDEVDILINNGNAWVGYQHPTSPVYDLARLTDQNGPIISASQPSVQLDGSELQTGDIWIDSGDLENYPVMYKYKKATDQWMLVDKTDQTTENGVIFGDARYGKTGASGNTAATIKELLVSDYVDPDCPDPALYPEGMLLFNTRRSGFNVKRFEPNYINKNGINTRFGEEDMSQYDTARWVTTSSNNVDGSGSFGRHAQRKVVLNSMQAGINSNDEIRNNEARIFNLIAAPGYPEMIGEMISLNYDRGLTAFVVGDSPMRLTPDATSLNNWATNVRSAVEDNDNGLVTSDEYLGVFYPSGFSSDNFGNNVVVPASHMMLRTIALSDQVSYPWFAPAGTRRGGITNATSVGYISSEGEFVATSLNEGQRDTLYSSNVNPITFITGSGIVNFGQKTRARNASSLDRINVARLVIYLRRQLDALAKPYIFEPNDKITRDEIKQQVESLLLELVGQRALYDFLVVCDETNNTPNRIDRNELYVDIAIEPVKSIEFIYIPLRLKNTGEIAGA